jgi:hypothetical protein
MECSVAESRPVEISSAVWAQGLQLIRQYVGAQTCGVHSTPGLRAAAHTLQGSHNLTTSTGQEQATSGTAVVHHTALWPGHGHATHP